MKIIDQKIIGLFVLLLATVFIIVWYEMKEKELVEENKVEEEEEIIEEPKLQIIDEDSDSRILAIMINNHPNTRPHHAGLQDAFIVYEIIVEGTFTRLLALYRDQETERIGSVRSARHYFLDYALEYDAIFIHFGGSPKSYTDLRALGVSNLDFIARRGFYRDNTLGVAMEHRAYTSMALIKEQLENMNMRMTSTTSLLNYSIDEIVFEGEAIDEFSITYGRTNQVSYEYRDGFYYRSVNDVKHTDAITDQQYHFKNIVIMRVANYNLDNRGRQELDTVGTGTGYFLSNGVMKDINWSKTSRSSQTVYTDKNGEPLVFNDGNTIFQIVPMQAEVNFIKEL